MKQTKNLTPKQIADLEAAVTLGMGNGWLHNAGKSSRACCSWKPITEV